MSIIVETILFIIYFFITYKCIYVYVSQNIMGNVRDLLSSVLSTRSVAFLFCFNTLFPSQHCYAQEFSHERHLTK